MNKKEEKLFATLCGLTAAQINSAFKEAEINKLVASLESDLELSLSTPDMAHLPAGVSEKTQTL